MELNAKVLFINSTTQRRSYRHGLLTRRPPFCNKIVVCSHLLQWHIVVFSDLKPLLTGQHDCSLQVAVSAAVKVQLHSLCCDIRSYDVSFSPHQCLHRIFTGTVQFRVHIKLKKIGLMLMHYCILWVNHQPMQPVQTTALIKKWNICSARCQWVQQVLQHKQPYRLGLYNMDKMTKTAAVTKQRSVDSDE